MFLRGVKANEKTGVPINRSHNIDNIVPGWNFGTCRFIGTEFKDDC